MKEEQKKIELLQKIAHRLNDIAHRLHPPRVTEGMQPATAATLDARDARRAGFLAVMLRGGDAGLRRR